MKIWNRILNAVMAAFFSSWACFAIFRIWHHAVRPEHYAFQSAPWYTGILIQGILTAGMLVLCLGIKGILHLRQSRNPAADDPQ